jgi:hypothetical protein
MLSNGIRGHLAELGVVSAKGRNGMAELFRIIANGRSNCIQLRRASSAPSSLSASRLSMDDPRGRQTWLPIFIP